MTFKLDDRQKMELRKIILQDENGERIEATDSMLKSVGLVLAMLYGADVAMKARQGRNPFDAVFQKHGILIDPRQARTVASLLRKALDIIGPEGSKIRTGF